jgi:hypothetical protein
MHEGNVYVIGCVFQNNAKAIAKGENLERW